MKICSDIQQPKIAQALIQSRFVRFNCQSQVVVKEQIAKKYLKEDELKRNCRQKYCYINDPIDGGGDHATRWVPSAFILK